MKKANVSFLFFLFLVISTIEFPIQSKFEKNPHLFDFDLMTTSSLNSQTGRHVIKKRALSQIHEERKKRKDVCDVISKKFECLTSWLIYYRLSCYDKFNRY